MIKKMKIEKDQAGGRIDKFLAEELNIARSQVQKMIDAGIVLVNDEIAAASLKLKEGDKVQILAEQRVPEKELDLNKITIIENPEYLIINKPAGLIVHGGKGVKEKTLADFIVEKYPEIKKVGDDLIRPGIVHRLDKEVSGLMVVARNNDSFENLKKQFKNRSVIKEYTSLVYGAIEKETDQIDFLIRRSRKDSRMVAVPVDSDPAAKLALTEIEILQKFINYTLLKVKIKTGRTHQIRVHLLAYGHPIVGDNLYSTKKTREQNKKNNFENVFLCATKLSFKDTKGETQTYEVELPKELKEVLKRVK